MGQAGYFNGCFMRKGKMGTRPPSLYPNQYEHKTTSARKSEGLGRQRSVYTVDLVTGKMTKEGLKMLWVGRGKGGGARWRGESARPVVGSGQRIGLLGLLMMRSTTAKISRIAPDSGGISTSTRKNTQNPHFRPPHSTIGYFRVLQIADSLPHCVYPRPREPTGAPTSLSIDDLHLPGGYLPSIMGIVGLVPQFYGSVVGRCVDTETPLTMSIVISNRMKGLSKRGI
ncbi:hypothetical protein V502_06050 [Pseudogymnoascus sp. VKM F-4520 (FW-2644)]|nr:hypothetical protein V502_06050 [Pseudogymnoascus sp. VKM F-4520 (FW-2644)]